MSSNHPDPSDITNQDPNVIAKQAEQDLNTFESKQGHYTPGHAGKGPSDSTIDSGINQDVAHKFQGGSAESGSTGASSNRTIPLEEGGRIHPETGRMTKAKDFEGTGGPEDKMAEREFARGGDQDVQGNVRIQGETKRP